MLTVELGSHIIDNHGGTLVSDHRRSLVARDSLSKGCLAAAGVIVAVGALFVPSEVQGVFPFVS